MNKTLIIFSCLFITATLLFTACDHDNGEDDFLPCGYYGGYATLYVENSTSSTAFDEFYITPSSSTDWGIDYITDYLDPTYYFAIYDIPAGYYDLLVGAGGDYLERDYNCFEGGYEYTWTLTDSSGSYRDSETVIDAALEADTIPDEIMSEGIKYKQ